MAHRSPEVTKEAGMWVIRLAQPSGKHQEYRCPSENQARALAALLVRPAEPAGSLPLN